LELPLREADIRLALARVVGGERPEDKAALGSREPQHRLSELADGELARVADVHRAREVVGRVHRPDHRFDEIVDVAKAAGLPAVAIERDVLAPQGLDDEVGHDPPVVGVHARAVGVEDAHNLDAQVVLPAVVEEERLGAALSLVVAAADADRVDRTPVGLGLRVDIRVAVDLGGRSLEDPRLHALGKAQHVDRPVHARLGRLHRVELVVDGRGGTGEVVDLVDFDVEREAHVVAHEFESRVAQEVGNVVLAARVEVVQAQHVVSLPEQALAKVGPEEAGTAGDEDSLHGKGLGMVQAGCSRSRRRSSR